MASVSTTRDTETISVRLNSKSDAETFARHLQTEFDNRLNPVEISVSVSSTFVYIHVLRDQFERRSDIDQENTWIAIEDLVDAIASSYPVLDTK